MPHAVARCGGTIFIGGVFVRGRMHTADTETGHGAGEVEVGGDSQRTGIRVQNVKVVARETVLHHHGLQTVHQELGGVVTLGTLQQKQHFFSNFVFISCLFPNRSELMYLPPFYH